MSDKEENIDFMALISTLWRGKLTIFVFAVVALLIGGYNAFAVAVPQYTATTSLALELRSESVVDIESVISGISTDTTAINTELEVIRSRELLEKLVIEMNLLEDPEFNRALNPPLGFSIKGIRKALREGISSLVESGRPEEEAPKGDLAGYYSTEQIELNDTISNLWAAVSAVNVRSTYVFEIKVTTTDPIKSARLSDMLAKLYIQDQINIKFRATENAVSWLSERVVGLESELSEKENALKKMRVNLELASPEALEAINQQARDVRNRVTELRVDTAALQARRDRLWPLKESDDLEGMVAVSNDPNLKRLLSQSHQGDTRATLQLKTQFLKLVTQSDVNLQRSMRQAQTLEASLKRLDADIARQTVQLIEFQKLERDAESTRTLYETFQTRLKETAVQKGLQQADSRIISEATLGTYVAPRKMRILILSAFLGVVLGSAAILMRQFMHRGFRTSGEIEAMTGMLTIGQIPKMPIRSRDQLVPYLTENPTSAVSEAIRNLRTSILLSDVDNPPQIIMSTSSIPGEGKTTQAIALAQNFVGLGKRVLLVEGDIRRRTFAEYFDISAAQAGLITALDPASSIEDIVLKDSRLGVEILVGEASNVNAADIFSSQKFEYLLQRLREKYDYIIIDSPPVLVVPDARVMGRFVDSILFSVAWDRTNRSQVMESLKQLEAINLSVSGIVMSQVDPKGMRRYGYGDANGAYGSYGSKYYNAG